MIEGYDLRGIAGGGGARPPRFRFFSGTFKQQPVSRRICLRSEVLARALNPPNSTRKRT